MIEIQTLGGRNILMVMLTLGPSKMTTEHAEPLQKFSRASGRALLGLLHPVKTGIEAILRQQFGVCALFLFLARS